VVYNKQFFSLYENIFLEIRDRYDSMTAVDVFTSLMCKGLKKAYGSNFAKGNISDFIEIVSARDIDVGIDVEFKIISNNRILYRFLNDPFPGLKHEVDSRLIDATYINFKVNYLLGESWDYKTNKHLWQGHDYTEHEIYEQ